MSEPDIGTPVDAFQSTAPEFDYWSKVHALAAERLAFAVNSGILLTVFTGAAGSGKSTVVRKVMSDAQSTRLIGMCSYGPRIKVDPCRALLEAFGADPGPGDKALHRRILEQSLEAARQDIELPTLVLEDAHLLHDEHLFALFDIAGFNDGPENALLKIVLVGHPALEDQMDDTAGALPGPSFALDQMSKTDTAGYVRHRLAVAGIDVVFDDAALEVVHERTDGNPQQVNQLCKALLDEARSLEQPHITASAVQKCKVPTTKAFGLKLDAPAMDAPATEGDAKTDPPPSFKSNRPLFASEPVAPPAPASGDEAKKGDAKVGPTNRMALDTADPRPAPKPKSVQKRGARSPARLIAGLAGVAGMAVVAYGMFGPGRAPDDAMMVAGQTGAVPEPVPEVTAMTDAGAAPDQGEGVGDIAPAPELVVAQPLPRLADTGPALALLDSFGAPPSEVDDWYRLGLSVADQNPQAAAVAFALAASQGHARAAYFLGQIYELGEGIPVDHLLARKWYETAATQIDGAADRLTTLPEPQAQGAPAPPVPLMSYRADDQKAVMVWTSAPGTDPDTYLIEFADGQGNVVGSQDGIESSVLRYAVSEQVVLWRVRARVGDTVASDTSDWFPLDLTAGDATEAALIDR
ncbi:AAA family ATPase [Aliiroseovarius sp. Z3]|uniref:AAA family ATPase n=1 Tax=Aliiroseovarius sp. Z3 TaxID=2811402 RepID=UPI0023B24800|nr:AAA family ATPase [Aliiroseovarius sp. Z3]MDE9452204.1 AAA family ATPase [Aliiroseovarius sp. Z3]